MLACAVWLLLLSVLVPALRLVDASTPAPAPTPDPTPDPMPEPAFACHAGQYLSQALGRCQSCQPGKYTRRSNRLSECEPAPPGSFVAGFNSTFFTACPPGTFTGPFTGSTGCSACPDTQYQSNPGSTTCEACPEGRLAPYEGATSASECLSSASNFLFGSAAVVAAIVAGGLYVVCARFRFASFIRRERVVMVQVDEYRRLMGQVRSVVFASSQPACAMRHFAR